MEAKLQTGSAPGLAIFFLLKLKPALNFICLHLQITRTGLCYLIVSVVMWQGGGWAGKWVTSHCWGWWWRSQVLVAVQEPRVALCSAFPGLSPRHAGASSCGWLLVAVGCSLWHDARADAGGSLSRTLGCGGDHKKTEQEPECGHKPAALVLAGRWPCWAAGDAVRARVGVLVSLPSSNQRDTLWPVVLTSTATLQVCAEHQMASREFNLRVRLHLKQFPLVLCFSPRQLICWG